MTQFESLKEPGKLVFKLKIEGIPADLQKVTTGRSTESLNFTEMISDFA